jgi:hypothetical protein
MVVARERLGKHVLTATDTHAIYERRCLRELCRGVTRKIIGAISQFCTGGSSNGASVQRVLEPEAENFSLLEAVTRQLLVKTLRAGKS